MNAFRKTLLATTLMGATAAAHAELSFNVAAASNYLFRGITQTDDGAAVSGGVDWAHDSGFYVGTWMSNVDFANVETDVYAGFGSELDNGLGYDVGGLYYHYPGCDFSGCDYAEIYGNLSFGPVSGGIAYTVWGEVDDDAAFDDGDIYYHASVDVPINLGEGVGLSVFGGYYDFDAADSYGHWGVSLSKDAGDWGSVSVNYEQTNGDDDDDVATDDTADFWVGWSKEF